MDYETFRIMITRAIKLRQVHVYMLDEAAKTGPDFKLETLKHALHEMVETIDNESDAKGLAGLLDNPSANRLAGIESDIAANAGSLTPT